MDKPAVSLSPSLPPSVAKRQQPLRNGMRVSTMQDTSSEDAGGSGDCDLAAVAMDTNPFGFSIPLSTPTTPRSRAAPVGVGAATPDPQRIDRSVESRTQFQITLPLSSAFSSSFASANGDTETPLDQRGWSSPHGEPYRPLGKPNLSLKFSPRLANGSNLLQNTHRMKVFLGKEANPDADKKAEVRHTQPASRGSGVQAASGLYDMFPLNFANKKRPLDERQVKFAHRLHASRSHYSPNKVRGLRRTFQSPLYEQPSTGVESNSPRLHHGADATSVDLLRHAIHECSTRLRAVKNGAGFLSQVPSSEHVDLLMLQEEYHRERAQFMSSHDSIPVHGGVGGARAVGVRGGLKSSHPLHFQSDSNTFSSADLPAEAEVEVSGTVHADNDDVYLPYTTRRAQQSPTKRHPTLTEFKSKLREEKMPRPLLSMQTTAVSSNANADSAGLLSPSSRSSIRASRVGGSVVVPNSHHRSPDKPTPESAATPLPSSAVASTTPASPTPGRRASIILVAPPINISSGAGEVVPQQLSDLTPMSLKRKPKPQPQQKKLHSVERLQAAVDAIEDAKGAHAKQLARTVESLNQNRRDCLAVKFQHLSVQHHLDDDLREMRYISETQRVEIIDGSVERSAWYRDLLKLLLSRDTPLHPAESLLVRAIRRITNDGHDFGKELLFRLVLLLHRDDLYVLEVQQDLTFVRQALHISLEDWAEFFSANGLPDPAEISDQKELKQEKLHAHVAKMCAVVTLNQAARNFSICGETDHDATT